MEKVTGRSDDMLIVRGVNVFPTQLEELALKRAELSGHYQVELSRASRLDEVLVRVEARPDGGAAGAGAALALAVKDRVGVSVRVEVLPPGGVERSFGKGRRVIDRRREGF